MLELDQNTSTMGKYDGPTSEEASQATYFEKYFILLSLVSRHIPR